MSDLRSEWKQAKADLDKHVKADKAKVDQADLKYVKSSKLFSEDFGPAVDTFEKLDEQLTKSKTGATDKQKAELKAAGAKVAQAAKAYTTLLDGAEAEAQKAGLSKNILATLTAMQGLVLRAGLKVTQGLKRHNVK